MSQSVTQPGAAGVEQVRVRSDLPGTWGDSVAEWEGYVEEKSNQSLVFVGDSGRNQDEILLAPYSHRFTDEYTSRQYARMMDFCRGARREYDDPHVVVLALTASTTTPAGSLRPPFDHLDELLSAWDRGVRYELNHTMKADRRKDDYEPLDFEYLQIREPTTDAGEVPGGYAHIHPVVVCDGEPERERLERVIDKHVEKCEWALPSAHSYEECIDIQRMDEIGNLGAYLFKYLGKSWGDLDPHQRRFNAMLWETGRRRFQPSDGAQRWMSLDEDDGGPDWVFVGVGENEKVGKLAEYDDAEEFRVVHETDIGTWLSGYGAPEAVDYDASDHVFERGRCVRCGVAEKALVAGRIWWDGSAADCPGRDISS